MSNKVKLNLNVNKDDLVVNDFLQAWESSNKRPSKVNIFKNYDLPSFKKYFEDKIIERYVQRDIIPYGSDDIINERFFCKLSNTIWVTYSIYDSLNEESFVGELSFYYDIDESEFLQTIIEDLEEFILSDDDDLNVEGNLYSVVINQNGFDLESIKRPHIDQEIENYYNDDVFKSLKKLAKKLAKNSKGLSILYGERGTGKTSSLYHLSELNKDKKFIYLPSSFFELVLNNPEFRFFLKKNNNSVLILDDCEIFFSDLYSKSNLLSNNLLQLVDGLDSDSLNLNLILLMNCLDDKDIDVQLLSCNNLIDVIEFTPLKKNKMNYLCKVLKKKNKFVNDTKLIDILRNKYQNKNDYDIGFD